MTWATIQQLVRILAYAAGSAYFGQQVADGEMFQAALGGLLSLGAFIWWAFVEAKKPPA